MSLRTRWTADARRPSMMIARAVATWSYADNLHNGTGVSVQLVRTGARVGMCGTLRVSGAGDPCDSTRRRQPLCLAAPP
jgi:hypothetical protein